jgi:hypothetical protein
MPYRLVNTWCKRETCHALHEQFRAQQGMTKGQYLIKVGNVK